MDWGIITGITGTIIGAVSLSIAIIANSQAKKANRIAEESLATAITANSIATEANQISSKSNAISQSALAVSADKTTYNWLSEFERKSSTLIVRNESPNSAKNVRITIRNGKDSIAETFVAEMPGFSQTQLDSDLFRDSIIENQRKIDRFNSSGNVYWVGVGGIDVTVHITWDTELGMRRSDEVKKRLS